MHRQGGTFMRLAKPHIDIGLFTNNGEAMLRFWQDVVGLEFEETLAVGGGALQHRHAMNGSVFKLNVVRDPLPSDAAPSGYQELYIAQEGLAEHQSLVDPDGNRVTLVPLSEQWLHGIAVRLHVRDASEFHRFLGEAMQFEAAGSHAYQCGDSIVLFDEVADLQPVGPMRAAGYRYLTVQVWDADAEYRGIIERGGGPGREPVTLGATARFGFVRDPDGNWIEISQRASLTGPLPA
jgi:lactoylglutathione lyase